MSTDVITEKSFELVKWITNNAIKGVPPLSSCKNLAQEYLIDSSYESNDKRINSLIRWEVSKNFTSGFITGLGGLLTMPISIPSALGASWIIQARMAGAIAEICGHSTDEDRVQTFVLISLLGDACKEVIKKAGIQVAERLTLNLIKQVPGRVLIEINKKVGMRLITKAGEKGVINLTKMIPGVGGVVGGCFDAYSCNVVGDTAKGIFM
jgi:hypothetical protein